MHLFFCLLHLIGTLTGIKSNKTSTEMKKSIVIAAIAGFVLSSCAKNYNCVCTDKIGGVMIGSNTSSIKATKKKATEDCDSRDKSNTTLGITSETACEIQ